MKLQQDRTHEVSLGLVSSFHTWNHRVPLVGYMDRGVSISLIASPFR